MAHFKENSEGVSFIEFAIVCPLLLLLCFGLYEAVNFISLNTKLNEISAQIAQWSGENPKESNIKDLLIGAWLMGQDYDFANKGTLMVTGIYTNPSDKPRIAWQYGTEGAYSGITTHGAKKVESAPFTIADAANLIVVEVTYNYTPFLSYVSKYFPAAKLYRASQSVSQMSLKGNSDDNDHDDCDD